jgi:hypothetical protein
MHVTINEYKKYDEVQFFEALRLSIFSSITL